MNIVLVDVEAEAELVDSVRSSFDKCVRISRANSLSEIMVCMDRYDARSNRCSYVLQCLARKCYPSISGDALAGHHDPADWLPRRFRHNSHNGSARCGCLNVRCPSS